jgi:uncharacterized membrane protein
MVAETAAAPPTEKDRTMQPEFLSQLYLAGLRWAHILAAMVAVGGLFYARFGLLPAMQVLDEESREKLHDGIRKRWLPWVIGSITLLLVSGLSNFLLFNEAAKAWEDGTWMKETSYHALFGVKFLLALGVFYFASGLVGRGEGTAWMRANRGKWLSVTILLAVAIVMLSGWMRGLHVGPNRVLDESADGVQLEVVEATETTESAAATEPAEEAPESAADTE